MDQASRVLVTGGNGYLASWIVKYLLDDGHEVHATVRPPLGSAKYAHLHEMGGAASGRLTLHEASLADADAFRALAGQSEYVIHTASPFTIDRVADPERDLVRPAVQGTRNVLAAAAESPSVRRVVLTSSVAAVYGDATDAERMGGRAFSEEDWNTTSSLQHLPYSYSKTLAEKAAWEIAKGQARWDLVVLNPGFILGPAVSPRASGVSNTVMRNFATGTYRSGIIDVWYGIVDVRDAARAHVRACFAEHARGRYILSGESASLWDIAQRLREEFGDAYPLPRRKAPKALAWLFAPRFGFTRTYVTRNVGVPVKFDNRKSQQDLGVTYRPMMTTLRDHFAQAAAAAQPTA